jgi:hypothetical protein
MILHADTKFEATFGGFFCDFLCKYCANKKGFKRYRLKPFFICSPCWT